MKRSIFIDSVNNSVITRIDNEIMTETVISLSGEYKMDHDTILSYRDNFDSIFESVLLAESIKICDLQTFSKAKMIEIIELIEYNTKYYSINVQL